jgi:hypothetical protein
MERQAPKGFRYVPCSALGIRLPGLMLITQEEFDNIPKCTHVGPKGQSRKVKYKKSDGTQTKICLHCMEVFDEEQQPSVSRSLLRALRSLFPHAPSVQVEAPGVQAPRVDTLVVDIIDWPNRRLNSGTVRWTIPIPQGSGLRFSFQETLPKGSCYYANSFGGKG